MKQRTRKPVSLVMIAVMVLTMTVGQSAFAASKVGKVKGVKATTSVKKKTIKLSWKKVKGASGYAIQKNTKKKFKKIKAVKVRKTKKTFKKLKVNKTYYFRIRAFKKTKSGRQYGKETIKKVRLERVVETIETTPTTCVRIGCPICAANEEFEKTLKGFTLRIIYPWEAPTFDSAKLESFANVEQAVESEYGVTVEQIYSFENYDTAMSASLAAGNPQAHVYLCKNSIFPDFFNKNYFCDLTDAMKKLSVNFGSSYYNEEMINFLNINDKQAAWSTAEYNPYVLFYNKDLVEQANLTDPKELVKSGAWTWNDLVEYCYATSKPLVVEDNNATALLKGMVASCGKSLTNVQRGQSPTTNINDGDVKESLSLIKHWSDNGYMALDAQAGEDFASGKAAMYYGKTDVLDKITSQFEVGVVPFPKRNQSQSRYFSVNNVEYVCFIPSVFKQDAEKILYLSNELKRYSYYLFRQEFAVEKSDRLSGDDFNMLSNLSNSTSKYVIANDFSGFCEIGDTTVKNVVDSVIGGMSAQDAINAHSASLSSAYETAWGDKRITGEF